MRVSVIGCGYLGAVHAASLAQLGHTVTGVDVDSEKIAHLGAADPPFYEPGFADLLRSSLASGRLRFSTDYADAASCDVHFICVGTPQADGSRAADLAFIRASVAALIRVLEGQTRRTVVVGKSTVPVGTARSIAADLALTSPNTVLVWNPEFLREGLAVKDTLEPDRIVYGLEDGERGQFGARTLDQIYSQALGRNTPKIETDYETAELVKVSANSFLALKISFINAVSRVCDATGASVTDLSSALGLDERIGPKFLRAGLGFGGGCLPKDLRAFSVRAAQLGAAGLAELLDQVDRINLDQRDHIVELTAAAAGPDLAGQRIAVLGVAFKPGTDDLRDSPALAVAAKLAQRGAVIAAYDPAAGPNLPAAIPNLPLTVAATPADAVKGATAVLVLTEWPEFSNLDPTELGPLVARPIVIDGRNTLDPALWRQSGWEYHGVGVR